MSELDFLGPYGGALSMAFASGCLFSFGALQKWIVSPLKSQNETLEGKLDQTRNEVLEIYKSLASKANNNV